MAKKPAPTVPVAVGDTIAGKYLVERILGVGGMGVVVAAKHLQLGETVAIKLLLDAALVHPDVVARFEREGRTAAKVRSEHVARVYDVGTLESGAPYIVMEHLEGRDLAALLGDRGTIPIEDAVLYLLQSCEALAEAHSLGIIHRDLKPGNLFLTKKRDGSVAVKLIDFGISKLLSTETKGQLTQPAMMMGSPLYMAPEQMTSARDADARSDIWSLGAILYQLLTGAPPYDGKSVSAVYDLIQEGPPTARSRRPNIPEGLDEACRRCLLKDPTERFETVADLAAALVPFGPPLARHMAESVRRILGAAAVTGVPAPSPIVAKGKPPAPSPKPPKDNEAHIDFDLAMPEQTTLPRAPAPPSPDAQAWKPLFPEGPPKAPPRDEPAPRAPPAPRDEPAPRADDDARAAAPDPRAATTIGAAEAVHEALGSHGISGKVRLVGKQLELHGAGKPVVIDVGPLGEQWSLLPADIRRRKSVDAARRLAEAQRAASRHASALLPELPRTSADLLKRLGALALLLVGAAFAAQLYLRSQAPPKPPPGVPTETAEQERQRLATTCTAMRQRVYSGASVGPYEAGGWAVELFLANRSGPIPRESPALTALVDGGKLAPSADDLLAKIHDGTLTFDDDGAHLPATARSPAYRTATLVFGGGYARAFFDPEQRPRFLALADRMAEATSAELGSLHARCAHLTVHDVGAWFRGHDAAGAATALVFGVGLFAERGAVDRQALVAFPGPGDLASLQGAATASKLDLATLKVLVGEQGGNVTALPGAVTLTFPVGGPVRATSASRALAKRMGIGKSDVPSTL